MPIKEKTLAISIKIDNKEVAEKIRARADLLGISPHLVAKYAILEHFSRPTDQDLVEEFQAMVRAYYALRKGMLSIYSLTLKQFTDATPELIQEHFKKNGLDT